MAHLFTQDRLSTEGSFVLCDGNLKGFPISYASVGFVDLFGYSASECVGTSCGALTARPNIEVASQITGHSRELVAQAIDVQKSYITNNIAEIYASDMFSCALLLNCKKNGDMIVNEVVMFTIEHPTHGFKPYAVGLQKDVTHEVSIKQLLAITSLHEYGNLIEERQASVKERMSKLIAGKNVAVYLSEKVSDVWQASKLDTLPSTLESVKTDYGGCHTLLSTLDTLPSTLKSAMKMNTEGPNSPKSICSKKSYGTSTAASRAQYADPSQTVLFFDWDDTLFPSSAMFDEWGFSSRLEDLEATQFSQQQEDELDKLQCGMVRYLTTACSLSEHVAVVTNAKYPWVEFCLKRFVPKAAHLFATVGGPVKIVYAAVKAERVQRPVRTGDAPSSAEHHVLRTAAKFAAMKKEVKRAYSQYPNQSWKNIVSIGDMPYEHDALQELTFLRNSPRREQLRTKLFITPESPSLATVTLVNEIMTLLLPCIVEHGGDLDVNLSCPSSILQRLGDALRMPELDMLALKCPLPYDKPFLSERSTSHGSCRSDCSTPTSSAGASLASWSGLDELEMIVHEATVD